jgi:hypothetical protein
MGQCYTANNVEARQRPDPSAALPGTSAACRLSPFTKENNPDSLRNKFHPIVRRHIQPPTHGWQCQKPRVIGRYYRRDVLYKRARARRASNLTLAHEAWDMDVGASLHGGCGADYTRGAYFITNGCKWCTNSKLVAASSLCERWNPTRRTHSLRKVMVSHAPTPFYRLSGLRSMSTYATRLAT